MIEVYGGRGGPGYKIAAEINGLQHDRGIVSMARGEHLDSAGSQFFIVHRDSNFLDGEYTAFGKIVPGTYSDRALDLIASLETGEGGKPLDVAKATIIKATILDPYTASGLFGEPDRNASIQKTIKAFGGNTENYFNYLHKISFDLPYRWFVIEEPGDYLNIVLEPNALEHNVQAQIDKSGYTPQIMIISDRATLQTASFFLIKGAEEPKTLVNYIFENDDGRKAHILISIQDLRTPTETVQFKILE